MRKCLPLGISGVFFTIFGIVHAIRLAQGWDVVIDGVTVPMVVSMIACPISFLLAIWMFVAACKKDA